MHYLLVLVMIFCLSSFAYAETIILKSGKKIEGRVIERTDKYVKIDFLGTVLTYFSDEIERIEEKAISVPKKTPSMSSSSNSLTALSAAKKEPQQIFKEVSPAIVYITTKTLGEYVGSGFIVDSSGVIATNAHVVQSAQEIYVKLKDGSVYPATGIIHYDVSRDLCLLKIDAPHQLPIVTLGDSNAVQIGEKLYCIGNPLGLEYSFSDGMLSGVRELSGFKWLQFTAPISFGNSGGPILNSSGEVIGIASFILLGGQNLNFALAVNELKPYISTTPKMSIKQFTETISQADYYYTKGLEADLQSDFDQAISDYSKAIQINPNFALAYNNRAIIYAEKGNLDQAISDYDKAIQIDPNLALAYYNRGKAYQIKGNFDQAISDYNKAIQIAPDFAFAYSNRGLLYHKKGNFDQAISDYNKAIQIAPDDALAYNNRGNAYKDKGNLDQAISDFNKAIQIDPNSDLAYYNRGAAYVKNGNLDQAISDLNKAIQINPNDALSYHGRGLAYQEQGNFDQAISDYNKAIQISPNDAIAYNNRGILYHKKGNLDQAISDFNKAIQIDSTDVLSYNNRGYTYFLKKEYDKAWKDVHKAEELGYKIDPKFLEALKKESGRER